MRKKQARTRALIGKGILGVCIIAAFFSCGCIDTSVQDVIHTPETFTASGLGNEFDFRNGYPNDTIIVSGIGNIVYMDFGDRAIISGIGNEVIRG